MAQQPALTTGTRLAILDGVPPTDQNPGADNGLALRGRVAGRLIRVCLSTKGSIARTSVLQAATRCALLADLALVGVLHDDAHAIEFDDAPTGFPAADTLLDAILSARPEKSIKWWVEKGPPSADDVIADLLATGVWTARRHGLTHRYEDTSPRQVMSEHTLIKSYRDTFDDAATAAFVMLSRAAGVGLPPRFPTPELARSCGPAEWLVPDLAEYLATRITVAQAARYSQ